MTWIGVDMDGTFAKTDPAAPHAWVIGEPILPMVERVKQWFAEGKEVRIFTARVSHGPDVAAHALIAEWTLRIFGVALQATCVKDDYCEAIYDDRAGQVRWNTGEVVE